MARTKYTRQSDGYYQTKIWDGTYTDLGKKKYVTLRTKKSSKDLENKVSEFKRAVEERQLVRKSDVTFCHYAREWLSVYKSNREKNTIAMYNRIITVHLSSLEGVRIADISRIHYQVVINNAEGHPRTQQQINLTFKQIIKSAIADRYLPARVLSDIFDNVDPIKYRADEKRPLLPHEKKAIFDADLSPADRAYLYILYGCGLRRGEALALTRFNVDLKSRSITVRQAIAFDDNDAYQKGPKSANGTRTVPIPAKVYPAIRDYVRNLHREKLFVTKSGDWVTKSSYRRMWERILRQLNAASDKPIYGLTAHVFRHNYCTNLCYQIPTVSIKKIAELLGDTEKMVMDVYNHILLEKEDAVAAVENALNF